MPENHADTYFQAIIYNRDESRSTPTRKVLTPQKVLTRLAERTPGHFSFSLRWQLPMFIDGNFHHTPQAVQGMRQDADRPRFNLPVQQGYTPHWVAACNYESFVAVVIPLSLKAPDLPPEILFTNQTRTFAEKTESEARTLANYHMVYINNPRYVPPQSLQTFNPAASRAA